MWSVRRLGVLAGAAGGLVMILAGLVLQPLANVPTLPELMQDRLLQLTPGPLFGLLIDRLQTAGRPLLYSGLLLVELVVLAAVGGLAAALEARQGLDGGVLRPGRQLRRIATLAVLVWLVVGLVVIPLTGAGPFAANSRFASVAVGWGYLLEAALYSVVTWLLLARLLGPQPDRAQREARAEYDPMRRGVSAGVAVTALATLGGTALWRYRADQAGVPVSGAAAAVAPTPAGPVSSPAPLTSTPLVTPTSDFYVVSKNIDDPVVRAEDWRLSVKGLVRTPFQLSYQELTALPSVEQYRTFACISNDVGGSEMSNALWRGVPLASLLDKAGADPAADFVLFRSADGYTESLPMTVVRQDTSLVAHQMNGAALPSEHGFPARVVIAGHYGMKQPKWLTEIDVAKGDESGFWEHQGWDEQAIVRTTSRIDAPKEGTTLPIGPVSIGGVAFAGDRGIKRVEVQVEPSGSWQDADVQHVDAVSTWAAWRYVWTPAGPGSYHISVRATDGTGALQDATPRDSYPSGATGLHTVTVQVR
jgi:DMSO/TMAO reductase YedYZ molybdopterin-dependent catalytic subunit